MLITLLACGVVVFSVLARRVVRGAADLRPLGGRAQHLATALLLLCALAPLARVLGGRVLARGLGQAAPAFDGIVAVGSALAVATAIAGVLLYAIDGARHATRRVHHPAQPGAMGRRELFERAASATALVAAASPRSGRARTRGGTSVSRRCPSGSRGSRRGSTASASRSSRTFTRAWRCVSAISRKRSGSCVAPVPI